MTLTGLEGIEPTNKHDITKCRGCMYLSAQDWCNYREMTGRSRLVDGGPLHPDGGCSLYKKGRTRKPRESPWGKYIRYDHELNRKKSEERLKEKELAKERAKRYFPPSKFANEIEHYYDMGLTDAEIARRVGCGHTTVYRWRQRNNLKSNFSIDPKKAVENDKTL